MKNQEIYQKDPLVNRLANNGVAEVAEDRSQAALETLRYELETFVCDGQYQKGLERILQTFLDNLGAAEQPGIWISGYYGSGKSHLAKMLRSLWVEEVFPDGATARGLTHLPDSVRELLKELSTQGKRLGGLHATAGKLGAGANDNVRLALLGMVFRSSGLPEQYHQAQFVLWLKSEGLYDAFVAELQSVGETLETELPHLYVSPILAKALLKVYPDLAASTQEVRQLIKAQFPTVTDVTNDEMVSAIKDALTINGKFPLTLIVLDEVQQFASNDIDRVYKIQEVTETCCKRFAGRLLFVGTGQMALSGTPSLQKLMGRFPVPIALSDADVDRVIRKIILAKRQSAIPVVEETLTKNLGEVSRHLRGTKIEHRGDDESVMVADYPILPTRRRFWERLLHTVDTTGTVAQLRNQLRIVHEAAQASAAESVGYVVGGEFIYDQIAPNLLQTAVMSREVYEHIQQFSAGDTRDKTKANLLKLVFLINKLPTDAVADTGVRPTSDTLADLLVTDLHQGSGQLRKDIPVLLDELQNNDSLVMAVTTPAGVEYRLQTAESSAWHDEYRRQEAEFRNNVQRLEYERLDLFKKRCQDAMKQVRLAQGQCKEPRNLHAVFDAELPKDHGTQMYAWFQDGWSTNEQNVVADARNLGNDDPSLFVFIPARNKTELSNAIIARKAAEMTIELRGAPNTPEGEDARSAMATRLNDANKQTDAYLREVFNGIRVFQSGGQEVDGDSLAEKLTNGATASLVRLYPQFDIADHIAWGKTFERAKKGDTQALEAVGHKGDADKQPVASAILKYLAAGKKGADIRDKFKSPHYGWPQDAIDGALYALLASGHILAEDAAHRPVEVRQLERAKITQTFFKPERVTITPVQLIQIRKLFQAAGVACQPGEEQAKTSLLLTELRERAQAAGGAPPKPETPDLKPIQELGLLTGNALLAELFSQRDDLTKKLAQWQAAEETISQRSGNWTLLQALLNHAKVLGPGAELIEEADAILAQRALLREPDPTQALLDQTITLLRSALTHQVAQYNRDRDQGLVSLEADGHWHKLDATQQEALLKKHGLDTAAAVKTASADDLLEALDETTLSAWEDRRKALAPRFDEARMEAARLLEPKVVHVQIPHRTLHDEAELKAWLGDVEALLRDKLKDGPVML